VEEINAEKDQLQGLLKEILGQDFAREEVSKLRERHAQRLEKEDICVFRVAQTPQNHRGRGVAAPFRDAQPR